MSDNKNVMSTTTNTGKKKIYHLKGKNLEQEQVNVG